MINNSYWWRSIIRGGKWLWNVSMPLKLSRKSPLISFLLNRAVFLFFWGGIILSNKTHYKPYLFCPKNWRQANKEVTNAQGMGELGGIVQAYTWSHPGDIVCRLVKTLVTSCVVQDNIYSMSITNSTTIFMKHGNCVFYTRLAMYVVTLK